MNKQQLLTLSAVASMIITSGCASMAADNSQSSASSDASSSSELLAAQRRVTELESALETSENDLKSTRSGPASSDTANASMGSPSGNDNSLFPPNPVAGQCYARVLTPATFRTVSEKIVTREASERFEVTAARYDIVEETVLVREASSELEVIPATYEVVQERVLVKPASKTIAEIPATYETVAEQVVDKPAHTIWKKGSSAFGGNVLSQTTTDTGEVMCLVEVPASYKTVSKRVLTSPARTDVTEIPAEYTTVSKRVVKTPPSTREIIIPAQYDTVQVTKLVAPAAEKKIAIPATYDVLARDEKVSDEQLEWRQVMCEVNMTRSNVMALQSALKERGYYRIGVDGIIGEQTLAAARAFAAANDLPAGSNYITIDVIKKLNLAI